MQPFKKIVADASLNWKLEIKQAWSQPWFWAKKLLAGRWSSGLRHQQTDFMDEVHGSNPADVKSTSLTWGTSQVYLLYIV